MKKVLILTAAMALLASAAFAGGLDLSYTACPGGTGAAGGEIGAGYDCTSGAGVQLYLTFTPNENIPDFGALDAIMDAQVGGDLTTNSFWNFDQTTGCNAAGLSNAHGKPTGAVCAAYTATFAAAGSGEAISVNKSGPAIERFGLTVYTPTPKSLTTGTKYFGCGIFIDGSAATEFGGTCGGCTAPFFLVANIGYPRSGGAVSPTDLGSGTGLVAGYSNQIGFNGGMALCCQVPTKKHTWGQLKSLYR